jgi:protein SCO1/2
MASLFNKRASLLLLLLIPILFVAILKFGAFRVNTTLPIYGERYLPKGATDTVYHTVGEFSFTDQKGNIFTQDTVKGKIRVTNFFFARCKGVCPKMNGNLHTAVYEKYGKSPNIVFVSHTVDPTHDTAEVLNTYAKNMATNYKHWYFVTGRYKDIAEVQNQYLLPKADGSSVDQIAHSQHIILVDKEDRIRGAYDGLDYAEMKKLEEDIKILLAEYKQK